MSLTTSFVLILLLFFSVGYTYAYFSQKASASASLNVYSTSVEWRDGISLDKIGNGKTIALQSTLKRGTYTEIRSADGNAISLLISYAEKSGELASYCRLKLTASYINSSDTVVDCSQYLTLANKKGNTFTNIEDSGNWSYENGYYYYKTSTGLIKVENEETVSVASYLYLDGSSNADIFGSNISITLTVEMAQVANDGYRAVWGI